TAEAKKMFEAAVDESERLVSDVPFSADYREMLLTNRNRLAYFLSSLSDHRTITPEELHPLALIKKNLELDPSHRMSWIALSRMHLHSGDIRTSITALERAMSLNGGGDAWEWFLMAEAHAINGDSTRARQWYNKAVRWMESNHSRDVELQVLGSEA